MGDADHPIAGGLQDGVADAVVFEGRARAVVGMPIKLDHQPSLMPNHVDQDACDEHVHLGHRKAGVAAELKEPALEFGAGDRRGPLPVVDDRLQAAKAAVPRTTGYQALDGAEVDDPQALRLIERPPDLRSVHDLGQVEQRTRQTGDRDRVLHGAILGDKQPWPV